MLLICADVPESGKLMVVGVPDMLWVILPESSPVSSVRLKVILTTSWKPGELLLSVPLITGGMVSATDSSVELCLTLLEVSVTYSVKLTIPPAGSAVMLLTCADAPESV